MHDTAFHDKTTAVAALVLIGLLVLSGIHPYDRATWLMEVLPVIIALPLMAGTHKRYENGHRAEALARPLAEEIVGCYGDPADSATAELLRWLDVQTKRNLVITFGGGVNEVMREQVAASGLKVPRVPR